MADAKREFSGSEIAIVGMACRFPGASEIEQFWRNLVGGVESLTLLTDDDLARAGVPPELIAVPMTGDHSGSMGVQEHLRSPGRYFINPLVNDTELVDLTVIPAGDPQKWRFDPEGRRTVMSKSGSTTRRVATAAATRPPYPSSISWAAHAVVDALSSPSRMRSRPYSISSP